MATGLGSNDIGIDRGQTTGSRIVKFERGGPRVLMVQPNYQFRALTQNPAEAKTVRDAFARSVLWSFPIAAASDGRDLVDYTDFLVRDCERDRRPPAPRHLPVRSRPQQRLLRRAWRRSRRTPRWRRS